MLRDNLSWQAIFFITILLALLAGIVWSGYLAWKNEGLDTSDPAAVADASTATNFQLATVYPNASFGANSFLIIPLINAASLLLSISMTQKFLERLLNIISKHATPHQYASDMHNIPLLKRFTAMISLVVFVAVATFEIVFLARIGNSVIGANPDGYYGLVVCIILLLVLATTLGGQRTSLIADKWLLPVAYIGVHLAIASLLLEGKPREIDAISVFIFLSLFIVVFLRVRVAKAVSGRQSIRHWVVVVSTLALLVAMLSATLNGSFVLSVNSLNSIAGSVNPTGSGLSWPVFFVAILGAICPAILYNFVDFSFWQKYSIELKNYKNIEECANATRRPFWIYLVESPLSWLLPVLLGLYVAPSLSTAQAADPVSALFVILAAQSDVGRVLSLLLFASLTAIAISTSASYLAALGDLWRRDISTASAASKSDSFSEGWHFVVGIGLIMIIALVPLDIFAKTTDQLILLLLTSFAPLCALTPLVAWPLFRNSNILLNRFGKIGIILAVSVGSISGLIIGVFGVALSVGPASVLFWISLPISFFVSWTIYLIAVFFFSEDI